jgi:Na+/proline symporter
MNMLVSVAIMIYLIITIVVGVWASRKVKNTKDFELAGRRLPLMMSSCVIFATWFGSEAILGT